MKATCLIIFIITSLLSFGQRFVISLPRENTLYKGIDNPIDVVLEGSKCDKIIIASNNGKIQKNNDCSYVFKANSIGITDISVYKKHNNDSILIGTKQFRVKEIPNPTPRLSGKKNGEIDKKLLLASKRIDAIIEGFDFDLSILIKSYSVFIVRKKDSISFFEMQDCKITEELIKEFQKLSSGDRIYFEDIIAKLPDNKDRYLIGMKFIIK